MVRFLRRVGVDASLLPQPGTASFLSGTVCFRPEPFWSLVGVDASLLPLGPYTLRGGNLCIADAAILCCSGLCGCGCFAPPARLQTDSLTLWHCGCSRPVPLWGLHKERMNCSCCIPTTIVESVLDALVLLLQSMLL